MTTLSWFKVLSSWPISGARARTSALGLHPALDGRCFPGEHEPRLPLSSCKNDTNPTLPAVQDPNIFPSISAATLPGHGSRTLMTWAPCNGPRALAPLASSLNCLLSIWLQQLALVNVLNMDPPINQLRSAIQHNHSFRKYVVSLV